MNEIEIKKKIEEYLSNGYDILLNVFIEIQNKGSRINIHEHFRPDEKFESLEYNIVNTYMIENNQRSVHISGRLEGIWDEII